MTSLPSVRFNRNRKILWSNGAWNNLPRRFMNSLLAPQCELQNALHSIETSPNTLSLDEGVLAAVQPLETGDDVLVTLFATSEAMSKYKSAPSTPHIRDISAFERRLSTYGDHGKRVIDYDWASTAVGPLALWSECLQTAVTAIMPSKYAYTLWITASEDPVMLPNEAYKQMLWEKDMFGMTSSQRFGSNFPRVRDMQKRVLAGNTIEELSSRWELPDSTGFVHERYFDIEWSPLYDSQDRYVAGLTRLTETTNSILSKRRFEAVRKVTEAVAQCRTIDACCGAIMTALSKNCADAPFAMLYTTNDTHAAVPPVVKDTPRGVCLELRANYGVPPNHDLAPSLIQLHPLSDASSLPADPTTLLSDSIVDAESLPWKLEKVVMHQKVSSIIDLLDHHNIVGNEWLTKRAIVLPIIVDTGAIQGALVIGLNDQRPLDEEYQEWFDVLTKQVIIGLAKTSATEQNELQASRLNDLERARSNLFTTISDELKNPLSLVLGPLRDALEDPNLPTMFKQNIKLANRSALRLMTLFNTLLDYFRLDGGRWTPTFRSTRLDLLTREVLEDVQTSAIANIKPFELVCEEVTVYMDTEIYEKILLVLIGRLFREGRIRHNTLKAELKVTDNGAKLVLAVSSGASRGASAVADTFPPSSPQTDDAEEQSSFDRLDIENTVLRNLVKLLKAEFFESHSRRNTRYTVVIHTKRRETLADERVMETAEQDRLPTSRYVYAAAALAEDSVITSDESSSLYGSSSGENSRSGLDGQSGVDAVSIRNKTVLLADANSDMRSYCRSALSAFFKCEEVKDGPTALSFISQQTPDLVILDRELPGMDAWALISTLREEDNRIPVIVLSSRTGAEARIESMMAGADELLVKPFNIRELVVRVGVQLQLAKMRIDLENKFEEKRSALASSQTRLNDLSTEMKTLMDMSTVGIFHLDDKGKVLYINPKWYELTGACHGFKSDQWPTFVEPEDLDTFWTGFSAAINHNQSCELTARWKSGKSTLVNMRPWSMADGTTRFAGSVVDVTELRRLEKAQLDASEQQRLDAERMRQLQEISVDVSSHELRNPLSAVTQAAELLSDNLDSMALALDRNLADKHMREDHYDHLIGQLVSCDETLETIRLCTIHQRRVADDILNFSKLNMQLVQLDIQPLDVARLAETTGKLLLPEISKHKMKLEVQVDASIKDLDARFIKADGHRLSQVIINFLTNAIRYASDASKRVIEVSVSASDVVPPTALHTMRVQPTQDVPLIPSDPVWITISVRDHGRGLSEEERCQLFNRFVQARPAADGLTGFGLGLFISKSIIHLHGGFIELRSTQRGAGSTFSFTIPAQRTPSEGINLTKLPEDTLRATQLSKRRPEHPPVAGEKDGPSSALLKTPSRPSSTAQQHVLIVDDSSVNLRLLQMQLEKRNYIVTKGVNGQEALDLIDQHRAVLTAALIDCEMPVMDGPTAVRELRRRETQTGQHMLCIAVTGNARDGQKAACLAAGYDHVVTKPYQIERLCELIQAEVAKQKTR